MSRKHTPNAGHVHYWTIEPPNGTGEVRGECRRCGEVKMFRSSHPLDATDVDPRWKSKLSHEGMAMNRKQGSRNFPR